MWQFVPVLNYLTGKTKDKPFSWNKITISIEKNDGKGFIVEYGENEVSTFGFYIPYNNSIQSGEETFAALLKQVGTLVHKKFYKTNRQLIGLKTDLGISVEVKDKITRL